MKWMIIFRPCVLLIYFQLIETVASKTILSFGDSWAYLGYDEFKDVMNDHGFQTALKAIPGTPSTYWATIEKDALVKAIENSNATHVYMSLGGNDLLEGLPLGLNINTIYEEMMRSTESILDKLFLEKPKTHVYHFGYEILDWSASDYCKSFGDMELKGSPPFCPDTRNVSCMTHAQATWLQYKYVDKLAKKYSNNKYYHGLNLLGTLQKAGGIKGAEIGSPIWTKYSPDQYVRHEARIDWGCVHLTPAGFTELYKELGKHVISSLKDTIP